LDKNSLGQYCAPVRVLQIHRRKTYLGPDVHRVVARLRCQLFCSYNSAMSSIEIMTPRVRAWHSTGRRNSARVSFKIGPISTFTPHWTYLRNWHAIEGSKTTSESKNIGPTRVRTGVSWTYHWSEPAVITLEMFNINRCMDVHLFETYTTL